MTYTSLVCSSGPARVCIVTNCPRMADEFRGSAFTRAMIPGYAAVEEDGEPGLFTVTIRRASHGGSRFLCDDRGALFAFEEATGDDNKTVYFEVLFFLQAWFCQRLFCAHRLFLVKASVLVDVAGGRAWLVVGRAGAGKSTLLSAVLDRAPPGALRFHDGKLLLDADGRLVGGNDGLSPRMADGVSRPAAAHRDEVAAPGAPPVPVAGVIFPILEAFAPPDRHRFEPVPGHRAVPKLLFALGTYATGAHNHLAFFRAPIPYWDDAGFAAQRYRLATTLAARPCWRDQGNLDRMARSALQLLGLPIQVQR